MLKTIKYKATTIFTAILWLIILVFICWYITICLWWIIAFFLYEEIFVPNIVTISIYALLLVLLWTTLVFLFFKSIKNVNPKDYEEELLNTNHSFWGSENLTWSEMSFTTDKYIQIGFSSNESQNINIQNISYPQLLSYGVSISKNGNIFNAMSILRGIVNDCNAPHSIRYAADKYLLILLKHTGMTGIQLYRRLKEEEKYEQLQSK